MRRTLIILFALLSLVVLGCRTSGGWRRAADRVADKIISGKQQTLFGASEPIVIESPADTLRRRLLLEQQLPYADPASLGTKALAKPGRWPHDDYLTGATAMTPATGGDATAAPLRISLAEALQAGARGNRDFQTRKEDVFRAALSLDLERNAFRRTLTGFVQTLYTTDRTGGTPEKGMQHDASLALSQKLQSGASASTRIAYNLAQLLTGERGSATGILVDASATVPLLRGAGRAIVTEPMTQAERDVEYALNAFERYKATFAVQIATEYLGVLRQKNEVRNARENYSRVALSAQRTRRLAEAGRQPDLYVGQATQEELRARSRWFTARQAYTQRLDTFKILLGLPVDAAVELVSDELNRLTELLPQSAPNAKPGDVQGADGIPPSAAEAPADLLKLERQSGELEESAAVTQGLQQRPDLATARGRVVDAQRKVIVAADALGAGLTLQGGAAWGSLQSVGTATADNTTLFFDRARYEALLKLDLPFERTAERNIYRRSLMALEAAVRDYQEQEDQVKLKIRNGLRNLVEYRETVRIQVRAVALADRRVASSDLFLQAGRAQMRDLLDAQDSLLTARNALTSALVSFRLAQLELQRDMGVLKFGTDGVLQENEK